MEDPLFLLEGMGLYIYFCPRKQRRRDPYTYMNIYIHIPPQVRGGGGRGKIIYLLVGENQLFICWLGENNYFNYFKKKIRGGKRRNFHCTVGKKYNFEKRGTGQKYYILDNIYIVHPCLKDMPRTSPVSTPANSELLFQVCYKQ